ncbi:MAG: hypothetical protein K9N48_00925 [Verrucomicrobia bacterium]|nr:hypothetical protein [Verrucomicrobiota bacterium]MCF7707866.1 hypothetical protein [Verrucomicrobiota bacterium]
MQTHKHFSQQGILELARNYHTSAVLIAAAELELFDKLHGTQSAAEDIAPSLGCNPRGMRVLLDALAAIGFLHKSGNTYSLVPETAQFLTTTGNSSIVGMLQHQGNCMRKWAQLASVVKMGGPAPHIPSVRGESGDAESFINAMHNISAPIAKDILRPLPIPDGALILDIGGADGTWSAAILNLHPNTQAVLFDLPHVIPMAENFLTKSGLIDRVKLVAGDYNTDPLPKGADVAWLSAIIHQNSPDENRWLYKRIHEALNPRGVLYIRDVVMNPDHVSPTYGALFAVNMLVGTDGGGTYTLQENKSGLESAGFSKIELLHHDERMNSIIKASK